MEASNYHASRDRLRVESMGHYRWWRATFGEFSATFEAIPAGFPPARTDLYRGLPDEACQVPHWGYVFRGKMKFLYPDGSEQVISAGEAYYAPPGHRWEVLEDTETVEFSPAAALEEHNRAVSANLQA